MRSRNVVPAPAPHTSDLLDEWVGAGLITPEQADRIRAHEEARQDRRSRLAVAPAPGAPPAQSLVVEALGYLGGVIMMVGGGILVGLYWEDIATVLQLLIVGVTTLVLVGAGWAVPDRLGDAAVRLRSVLWALAVAGTAAFLTIWSNDVLDRYDEDALIVIFPGTAVVAGVLWWLRRTWLQQVALLVPLLLAASAVAMELAGEDSAWNGGLVWAVALVCSALAW